MKLTPKGKRWADVIRKELSNTESHLSKVVRNFNAWKRLCANNPKELRFSMRLGSIIVEKFSWKGNNTEYYTISPYTDVGYLFGKDVNVRFLK